jgi:stage IV sporulation protein FB
MDIRVDFSGTDWILLALLCLILPLDWMAAGIGAAVVHETSHALAVKLLGGDILWIRIGIGGAVMQVSETDECKKLISILAGPAGSFLLLLLCNSFPKLALCGLVQGAYNLLPIYPLDGGRALQCLLTILFSPPKAKKVMACVTWICKILLLIFGFLFCCYTKHGFMILLICILTVLRIK